MSVKSNCTLPVTFFTGPVAQQTALKEMMQQSKSNKNKSHFYPNRNHLISTGLEDHITAKVCMRPETHRVREPHGGKGHLLANHYSNIIIYIDQMLFFCVQFCSSGTTNHHIWLPWKIVTTLGGPQKTGMPPKYLNCLSLGGVTVTV